MKYKVVALDLDGTLTNSNKKISEVNKKMIHMAMDMGVSIVLASGRPVIGIEPVAKELDLYNRGGYILAYNGGNIIDCKTNVLIYEKMMPKECIHAICDEAHKNGVYAVTYTKTGIVAESDSDEFVIKEAKCNNAVVEKVQDLESFVDYPVAKFLVVGPHEKLLPVQEQLLKQFPGVIDAFFSESYFLEIVPAGIAKDKSLERLLQRLQATSDELMACGDGMNDIPMLKCAGLSVVMENAYPEVKEYADFLTRSNDDDGVAYAIEKFIINEM